MQNIFNAFKIKDNFNSCNIICGIALLNCLIQ